MPPITLVIPWHYLVADNRKYGATGVGGKARLFLTSEYSAAKRAVAVTARLEGKKAKAKDLPLSVPVRVVATVYEPNRSRTRDVTNFCKLVHDALSGVIYEDDGQIDDARWIRGGIDKKNPRVEITITALSPLPETP
jgi:Holliday junction resolvase RusA-like endonuclease